MDVGRKKWVFPKRYFMNNDLLISNIPLHISNMKKATRQFCENYMLFENKSKQFGNFSKFYYMKFCSRPKRRSWSKRLKKLLESENYRNIHQHQQTEISIMFYFMLGQRQKIPRFDGSGRGELSDREVFNVLKMQHKVNISQEKVRTQCNVVKNDLRTVAITRFCWPKSPRCQV